METKLKDLFLDEASNEIACIWDNGDVYTIKLQSYDSRSVVEALGQLHETLSKDRHDLRLL